MRRHVAVIATMTEAAVIIGVIVYRQRKSTQGDGRDRRLSGQSEALKWGDDSLSHFTLTINSFTALL